MAFSAQNRQGTISGILFVAILGVNSYAQIDSTKGHYLYQPKPFSPPVQAMIKQFEGFPCTPLEAPDLEGKKHMIGGYKGKVTLLFFWRAIPGRGRDNDPIERNRLG